MTEFRLVVVMSALANAASLCAPWPDPRLDVHSRPEAQMLAGRPSATMTPPNIGSNRVRSASGAVISLAQADAGSLR